MKRTLLYSALGFIVLLFIASLFKTDPKPTKKAYDPGVLFPNKITEVSTTKIPKADAEKEKTLQKHFNKKTDEFEGITWITHKSTPKFVDINGMHFYFGESNNSPLGLRCKIQYASDDWLFIKKYDILIDGHVYTVMPDKIKRDNGSGTIWEWSDFPASDWPTMTEAVLKAKSIKIKFVGSEYHNIKTVSSKDLKAMQQTLEYFFAKGGTL